MALLFACDYINIGFCATELLKTELLLLFILF
jgi:hypothetical protein